MLKKRAKKSDDILMDGVCWAYSSRAGDRVGQGLILYPGRGMSVADREITLSNVVVGERCCGGMMGHGLERGLRGARVRGSKRGGVLPAIAKGADPV